MNFQFCYILSLLLSYLVFVGLLVHIYLSQGFLMAFPMYIVIFFLLRLNNTTYLHFESMDFVFFLFDSAMESLL